MDVKLWEGGLQSQEIKAIENIQKMFSSKPVSSRSKSARRGSMKASLRIRKRVAGFRFALSCPQSH